MADEQMSQKKKRPGSAASALSGRMMPKNNLMTPELESQLRDAFACFDISGDGKIDSSELMQILKIVNKNEEITIEEVENIIASVDDGGDGQLELPEFLKLIGDQMQENEAEEDLVSLFKSFGAIDSNDVITVGNLDKSMKEEGEYLKDEELQLIFEELSGASKRAQQSAEKRYARATGMTFHDFLLLLLAK